MFSSKNLLRILINTLIGVVLITLWLKVVNINEVIEGLKEVNLLELLPFVFFFILSNIFRALRLKLLLSDLKIPLLNLIFLNHLAQLLSFTIPLRIGEVCKGVYISSNYKVPFSKTIIWVLLDRFMDFWTILVLCLILLGFVSSQLPEQVRVILLLMVIGMSIFTGFIIFLPKLAKRVIKFFSIFLIFNLLKKYFIKISDFIIDTAELLNKERKRLPLFIGITFLAITADVLSWYVVFRAVFLQDLDFIKIFLGTLMSALTYLIPAAPGYVGSAEASGLIVFSWGLGFDQTLTSIAIVLIHTLTLICVLGLGLGSLYFLKFNLSEVWGKLRRKDD